MPILPVNARDALPDTSVLRAALDRAAPGAPVTILIHGFRYAPGQPGACPHRSILSLAPQQGPDRAAVSWPRHLGLDRPGAGAGIAFGWQGTGSIWGAWARAGAAGADLARLIAALRRIDPDRPVTLFAHSMGARVALAALHHLPEGAVDRALLLSAAVFRDAAAAAMDSPAGRGLQLVNVTSRENDLFDISTELLLGAGLRQTVSHGLRRPRANWLDLQLDHPGTLDGLDRLGFRLDRRQARICHWSPYLRPGVFALWQAILAGRTGLDDLRAVLPARAEPRGARLLPGLRLAPGRETGMMAP